MKLNVSFTPAASPNKLTYRGYEIEQTAEGWIVSLGGVRRAKAPSEFAAVILPAHQHKQNSGNPT